jgi:hypothetical protein
MRCMRSEKGNFKRPGGTMNQKTHFDMEIDYWTRKGRSGGTGATKAKAKAKFLRRSRAATLRGQQAASEKVNDKAKALIEAESTRRRHQMIDNAGPKSWQPDAAAIQYLHRSVARMMVAAIAYRERKKKSVVE